MEITVRQSNQLKSIAILMMLCLHLFNKNYKGLFEPLLFVGKQPLSFYISLFCDACVPIFAFVSGYGLYYKYQQNKNVFAKENFVRLKKLYINYWIILLIFPVIMGLVLKSPGYPGSWEKFFLNISGISPTYNGAWWFFTTYVLFVLTARFWFSMLEKVNPLVFLTVLFAVYLAAFYFRVYKSNLFGNTFLDFIQSQLANFFCTLFQFMLGAFALKFKWNSFIFKYFKNLKFKNSIISAMIVILVILHALVPNFIIAPFTGLAFILLYCQLSLSENIQRCIDFFTPHSTNLWLIHMFFYMIFFPAFVYSFRYPVIIFLVLVLICVLCSYGINFINKKIQKLI